MNWAKFQTYNDAPTKAFETLCNQLFENWCKEEYSETLSSFQIVNGSGGDGGVESYAVLSDEKIIGLQAKWFRESITSNQMGQIKISIITALKLRPKITRYIVCIPRDLASLTGKGDQTESKRWDEMKSEILKDYPKLVLDLWNETRLIHELQKDCSAGILKFWFERAEISDESVGFSFEKSKNSWLATKYLPELNTYGMIHNYISSYLGDIDGRKTLYKVFNELNNICNDFYIVADELIDVCGDNEPELKLSINDVINKFQNMQSEISKILYWLNEESIFRITINDTAFEINYNYIISEMEKSKEKNSYYFHFSAVKKIFKRFDKLPIYNSVNQFKKANDYRSLIVLGDPGTGKTHGVAAETEKLLNEKCHIPILVQARDIPATATWKDILISSLGLADSWSEEEIWQALLSLSNRRRMKILNDFDKVTILPKIIIIVDGIDESSLQDVWLKLVQETDVIIQKYPSIRFCFMSRPYVFSNKDTGAKIVEISHSGDVPTHKLFDNYIKTYNIDVSHAGWVKFFFNNSVSSKTFLRIEPRKNNYALFKC